MDEQQTRAPHTTIVFGLMLFTGLMGYVLGYGNGRDSRKRRKVFV